ncbi:DUF805 domain-containing protein [Selenomonadales bacterium OttesenSCG-928-I06]|nr:DUF805 domain-containing protein [Selenomonadales bacterium OttesenSCG-928-I06]
MAARFNNPHSETDFSLEAIKERYFSFEGRLSREPYFIRNLTLYGFNLAFSFIIYFVSLSLGVGIFTGDLLSAFFGSTLGIILFATVITVEVILLVAAFSLAARRLHDLNMSGLWIVSWFIILVIPYIQILSIIGMLLLYVLKGTDGYNEYGANHI